jgi:hypothetical protein
MFLLIPLVARRTIDADRHLPGGAPDNPLNKA